jgi:GDPmannose 4,6-dehydratase
MPFQKSAIIIGIAGQDGHYLNDHLYAMNYDVIGIGRGFINFGNRHHQFSLASVEDVNSLIISIQPHEIYYLAAHHLSSEQFESGDDRLMYQLSHQVHVEYYLNILTAVRDFSPHTKVFYASSSLIYDGRNGPVQNEMTPYSPVGIYGLTKLNGQYLSRYFRETFNISVSVGILYSHESIRRSASFLSKKIICTASSISAGKIKQLTVGSLEAQNDWGYAPDFVKAFNFIIDYPDGDDFIVATGELHTVAQFADIAFSCFGLYI